MLKTKSHEEFTIAEALRIAAEVYEKDAAECTCANLARVAEQFKAQANAARQLLDRIESGELELSTEYLSVTGHAMLRKGV